MPARYSQSGGSPRQFKNLPPGLMLPLVFANRKAVKPTALWAVRYANISVAAGRRYERMLKELTHDTKKRATEDRN